jgi:hypothetical protein
MDGMRLEYGYALLAQAGDSDNDGQQQEDAGEFYEMDFDFLMAEAENPPNIQINSADIHEALHAAEGDRKIEFVRHRIENRYWRPGRDLHRFIGQAQRVETSTSSPKTGLPDEPRSVIGKRLRGEAEVAERKARRPQNNQAGLKRW